MPLVAPGFSPTVAALLQPIDPHVPAGLFDPEDETYQAIDLEMVKMGGLHQGSIDWPYVEEASRRYLTSQCKQFRVLGHLLTAWMRLGRWEQWSDALDLLSGMVECYWATAHPKPGPTGYLAKRRQVGLLLERLSKALPSLASHSHAAQSRRFAALAVARLQRCAASAQLDQTALTEIVAHLAREDESADTRRPMPEAGLAGRSHDLDFQLLSKSSGVGNERAARRAALAMATTINQQDLYDPAGYSLRRFALWGHIHTPPAAHQNRCTELTGVPKDVFEDYCKRLNAASIEPALLLRIEKSVSASPFWIFGSYLASSVAVRLDMEDVAAAIRLASLRFVRRVPGVMTLCFSDGTAFVDDQTRAWLTSVQSTNTDSGSSLEYADLQAELVSQLSSEGVEVVLLRLQALQAGHSSPRQRCYASVIAADLLSARGLTWLAEDLYSNAARLMAATSAQAWEPDLYQRLVAQGGVCASAFTKS